MTFFVKFFNSSELVKIMSSSILLLWIIICELKPTILLTSSALNPFITDITIIKTATPNDIPINEKIDITFKKPSFFFVFKYLKAICFSNLYIYMTKLCLSFDLLWVEAQLNGFLFVLLSLSFLQLFELNIYFISLNTSKNFTVHRNRFNKRRTIR